MKPEIHRSIQEKRALTTLERSSEVLVQARRYRFKKVSSLRDALTSLVEKTGVGSYARESIHHLGYLAPFATPEIIEALSQFSLSGITLSILFSDIRHFREEQRADNENLAYKQHDIEDLQTVILGTELAWDEHKLHEQRELEEESNKHLESIQQQERELAMFPSEELEPLYVQQILRNEFFMKLNIPLRSFSSADKPITSAKMVNLVTTKETSVSSFNDGVFSSKKGNPNLSVSILSPFMDDPENTVIYLYVMNPTNTKRPDADVMMFEISGESIVKALQHSQLKQPVTQGIEEAA